MSNDRITKVRVERVSALRMSVCGGQVSEPFVSELGPACSGCCYVSADGVGADWYLQGRGLYFEPSAFGGISPDSGATSGPQVIPGMWGTTTQMPNQQSGVYDLVYVDNYGIICIKSYIGDNGKLICEDPTGQYQLIGPSLTSLLTSWHNPPVRVEVRSVGSFWVGNIGDIWDGLSANVESVNGVAIYRAGDGESPVEPFVVVNKSIDVIVISEY